MKAAVIIQARMGSTRLPGKVLMPVLGRPLLAWMLDRLVARHQATEIIVATTTSSLDDPIVRVAGAAGVRVYRGSEDDVLDRYYQAAAIVKSEAVVRITADCPLLDPLIMGEMIRQFAAGELDFLSNSEPLPCSWPDGMDVSVFGFEALEKAHFNAVKPSEREHVTFHFWNNTDTFRCRRVEHTPNLSKYRLTVDYREDFELIDAVIKNFAFISSDNVAHASMYQIINFLDENPLIRDLNTKYIRGLGWQSALQRDKERGF